MRPHRNPKPNSLRVPALRMLLAAVAMAAMAFLTTSCSCERCDQEIHIRAGEGAEGMVPGTVTVARGQTICWVNDDTVPHTVRFADSPGSNPAAAANITIPAGGKKSLKVHASKPSGGYELHIDPANSTTGTWPPTEPQVVVE